MGKDQVLYLVGENSNKVLTNCTFNAGAIECSGGVSYSK